MGKDLHLGLAACHPSHHLRMLRVKTLAPRGICPSRCLGVLGMRLYHGRSSGRAVVPVAPWWSAVASRLLHVLLLLLRRLLLLLLLPSGLSGRAVPGVDRCAVLLWDPGGATGALRRQRQGLLLSGMRCAVRRVLLPHLRVLSIHDLHHAWKKESTQQVVRILIRKQTLGPSKRS